MQKKHFVFSHLPKTGGTFITNVLQKVWEKYKITNKQLLLLGHTQPLYKEHQIYFSNCQDQKFKGKSLNRSEVFVLGCVRNPFDFYLSAWGFGCKNGKNTGGILLLLKSFFPHLVYLYDDINNIENFRTWLSFILQLDKSELWKIDSFVKNVPISARQEYNLGMMSYRTCILYFGGNYKNFANIDIDDNVDYMVVNHGKHTTTLNEDLLQVLQKINVPCSEEDLKLPKEQAMISNAFIYHKYYDEASKQLVYDKDKVLFERYNFHF